MEMLHNLTHIPQEIIEEILLWLPVKSICRFHCVSKSWKVVLTKPEFIKTHLNRTKKLKHELLLLFSESRVLFSAATSSNAHHPLGDMTALASKNLTFAGEPHRLLYYDVIASCDGLVLIGSMDRSFLINPTTREIKEIPVPPFANNPCATFSVWGVGYDIVSDHYKVAGFSYFPTPFGSKRNEPPPDFCSVYSVRNVTWKKVEDSVYGVPENAVVVHGSIHWLTDKSIEAFDFAEEKFYGVFRPSLDGINELGFTTLVALEGCLCLVCSSYDDREMIVWMMKEYGVKESWTKFTIVHHPEANGFWPLWLLDQEQMVVLEDMYTENNEKLVTYNLEEGMSTSGIGIPKKFHVVATFVESLISPYCSDEARRHVSIEECMPPGIIYSNYTEMNR